jgi:hypothetical protein
MLHRNNWSIEVTDDDIDRAMIMGRYSPLQIAISRVTNKAIDEVDVRNTGVFISVYEYADFLKYSYDDDCRDIVLEELEAWEDWAEHETTAPLYMETFTCNLTLERSF